MNLSTNELCAYDTINELVFMFSRLTNVQGQVINLCSWSGNELMFMVTK